MLKYILLLLTLSFPSAIFCQEKIGLSDLLKITIRDSNAGLGGGLAIDYEINNQNGKWYCTRKRIDFTGLLYLSDKKRTALEQEEAKLNLVKPVDAEHLEGFLKTLQVIKPEFDWSAFGISPAFMIHYTDTVKDKSYIFKKWGDRMNRFYTTENIKKAVEAIQGEEWTDSGPSVTINVIKKNNDTLVVSSRRQPPYMLPWTINGTKSYDVAISRFFGEVSEKTPYSNRARALGLNVPRAIEEYIYRNIAERALAYNEWQHGNPDNLDLLKKNFEVSLQRFDGMIAVSNLSHPRFPANLVIDARIDITNRKNIEGLIRCRDSIIELSTSDNFVLRFYEYAPGARIRFRKDAGIQTTDYFIKEILYDRLPVLAGYDLSGSLFLETHYNGTSKWVFLPDGRVVLLKHIGKVPPIIPSHILGLQQNKDLFYTRKDVYILLSQDGEVLEVSK